MADKLEAAAIEPNSITETQMNSSTWAQVYAALATANAAYDKANTAITTTSANITGNLIITTTGRLGLGISPNTLFHINGTSTICDVIEKINISATAMSSNVNFDILNQPILYLTSAATADCTLNFRANSSVAVETYLRTGQAVTLSIITTFSATGYRISSVQVDSVPQTVKWAGASVPSSGASFTLDLYTFTIVKTGTATYTVFGSQQRYG